MFAELIGKVTRAARPESDTCVLPISVGQPCHEEKKLKATTMLARENFAAVTIVVAGGLQRFTKAMSDLRHDPDAVHEEATREGVEWVVRNQKSIDLLNYVDDNGVRYNKLQAVLMWEDCIAAKKEDFNKTLSWLRERGMDIEDPFKRALDSSVGTFLKRVKQELRLLRIEEMHTQLSREYILEECAVMLTWNYQFLIYPGQANPAIMYLIEDYLHYRHSEVLQILTVKFPKQEYKVPLDKKPDDYAETDRPRTGSSPARIEGSGMLPELRCDLSGASSAEYHEGQLSLRTQVRKALSLVKEVAILATGGQAPIELGFEFAGELAKTAGQVLTATNGRNGNGRSHFFQPEPKIEELDTTAIDEATSPMPRNPSLLEV